MLVLMGAFLDNEGSCEPVHSQPSYVDEDSDHHLELELRWMCQHGRL